MQKTIERTRMIIVSELKGGINFEAVIETPMKDLQDRIDTCVNARVDFQEKGDRHILSIPYSVLSSHIVVLEDYEPLIDKDRICNITDLGHSEI